MGNNRKVINGHETMDYFCYFSRMGKNPARIWKGYFSGISIDEPMPEDALRFLLFYPFILRQNNKFTAFRAIKDISIFMVQIKLCLVSFCAI